MYSGSGRRKFEQFHNGGLVNDETPDPDRRSPIASKSKRNQQDSADSAGTIASVSASTTDISRPSAELSAQLSSLVVSNVPHDLQATGGEQEFSDPSASRNTNTSDDLKRQEMDVAYRPDGFGQSHLIHHRHRPAASTMYDSNERRTSSFESEPMWPVPRLNTHSYPGDRARDAAPFSSAQLEFARHPGSSEHYVYDSNTAALRNPIVYSQPVQSSWGAANSSSDYTYPTLPYINSTQRLSGQHGPHFANLSYGEGGLDGSNGESMAPHGHNHMMDSGEHAAEPLWPLAPNSLEAFAGLPQSSGSATRLTLTSASDRARLKARSSVPLPKQFKCSACEAIFSRNHDLKRHARIHLAVKPFPCGYCDKAFSRKDALKRHVLVKGCGIGSKKTTEGRRRSATLSKIEHGNEGTSISSGSGRGSRRESVLEVRSRDYLGVRDDSASLQQGLSRSFPSKFEAHVWNSNAVEPAPNDVYSGTAHSTRLGFTPTMTHGGSDSAEYHRDPGSQGGNNRGIAQHSSQHVGHFQPYSQLAQPYSYGSASHSGQYQHQMAGGLVHAFGSSEDPSGSSPADLQSRAAYSGMSMTDHPQASYQRDTRPSNLAAGVGGVQIGAQRASSFEGSG